MVIVLDESTSKTSSMFKK